MDDIQIIKPQPGFQEKMLSSKADIVIGGGSAGGGKTYALLLDAIRYQDHPFYRAMIFRRTTPQIDNPGGLWDKSEELYPLLGAFSKTSKKEWVFPAGSKVKFNHMEYEKNKQDHQGAQYPYIGWDELTHFTESQFLYLLSRNRSPHGIPGLVRATCNPDPDSWVADLIAWWIDQDTGFPIPERDGVLRYFARDGSEYVWGDTVEEVLDQIPHLLEIAGDIDPKYLVKSLTFIRGSIHENAELLKNDPAYLGNLLAQDEDERAMLLDGNWKVRVDGKEVFNFYHIKDLFTNFPRPSNDYYITVDVAGDGRDLAVIYVWRGMNVERIMIWTKSKPSTLINAIEACRKEFNVPKSRVSYDVAGMGWALSEEGYIEFRSNDAPLPVEITTMVKGRPRTIKKKENYKDLNAQCAFNMAKLVAKGLVSISLDDVWIDGVQGNRPIKVSKTKHYNLEDLIKKDLRSFKKGTLDMDRKLCLQGKASQKKILNGRSPDNGDAFVQRYIFELGTSGVKFRARAVG